MERSDAGDGDVTAEPNAPSSSASWSGEAVAGASVSGSIVVSRNVFKQMFMAVTRTKFS